MASASPSATVIITQRVAPGRIADYEAWQAGINAAAANFTGYQGVQLVPPVSGSDDPWVVVFRFDNAEHLQTWLDSDERAGWLARSDDLFSERRVVQTVATTPDDDVVTVVVSQRVQPGRSADYRRWQAGIDAAAARFPGFLSTEHFAPVAGSQDDHVVVFRFRGRDNLERWLQSDERARWLRAAEPLLASFELAKVGGGLAGWFPISRTAGAARVAPRWKQAMVVLLTLYPTVMLLARFEGPLLTDLPRAVQLLIANISSVAVLTWLLMPLATRTLSSWLSPAAPRRLTVMVAGLLVAAYAVMTAGFWLAFG